MTKLRKFTWSDRVEDIEAALKSATIFDKIEFSGISRETVKAKLADLRNRQVPQRTVLLNMEDEDVVFHWFKNWLHPMLKNCVKPSPSDKRGCSKEVLERDTKRDMLAFYENGQQNYSYTLAEIEAWANGEESLVPDQANPVKAAYDKFIQIHAGADFHHEVDREAVVMAAREVFYTVAKVTNQPSVKEDTDRGHYDKFYLIPATVCYLQSNWVVYPPKYCTHCGKTH